MKALLFGLLSAICVPVSACTCEEVPPTFCATMGPQWIGAPELMVLGVKQGDVAHGMDVRVVDVMRGSAQAGDVLRVWGDNGLSCRVYTSEWAVGDTLFLALRPTDYMGNWLQSEPLEQPGDYMIFICGVYHLAYANGRLFGPIAPGVIELPYTDLPHVLAACASTSVPEHGSGPAFGIAISGDRAVVTPVLSGAFTVRVLDSRGRTVFQRSQGNGPMEVPVGAWPAGCYLFRCDGRDEAFVQRIVVQN